MAMPWRSPPESLEIVRIGVDTDAAKAELAFQDIIGDPPFLSHLDEAEPVGDLAADEDVAPERLFLAERLFLIDRLEPQAVGFPHRIARPVDQLIADVKLAGSGPHDAGQHLDEGGFAGAVVADQPDDLVAADREVDPRQGTNLAVGQADILGPDDMLVAPRLRRLQLHLASALFALLLSAATHSGNCRNNSQAEVRKRCRGCQMVIWRFGRGRRVAAGSPCVGPLVAFKPGERSALDVDRHRPAPASAVRDPPAGPRRAPSAPSTARHGR